MLVNPETVDPLASGRFSHVLEFDLQGEKMWMGHAHKDLTDQYAE